MGKELRIDVGNLRPCKRRADGTLLVEGVLTRSGVFEYQDANGGVRREYRAPAEVFKADSMGSFELVPLTDNHPPELVTAENATKYAVGAVGAPRRDGAHLVASISVIDAATIAKVEAGKQELSCGYLVEVVHESGVSPEGERYDAIQRDIVGNHVALVDVARAGPAARLRMDGVDGAAIMVRADAANGGHMQKIRIDGVEYDVSEQVAQAFAKQDAAKTEALAAEKARADAAEGAAAGEKARADGLEKDLETERQARKDAEDPAKIGARVRARADLENTARSVLGAEADISALSDLDIQIAVVEKVDGDKIAPTEHERYIRGRFDSACKRASRADESLARLSPFARDAARTDVETDELAAARKMAEDSANAWKSSTSKESK